MNQLEQSEFSFTGIYRALVVDAKDPKKLGRVKIWCPDTMINVKPEDGIWAIPANNQLGGRNFRGQKKGDHYYQGTCFIPPKDSWVWIFFQYGNPSLPCYFAVADLESIVVPSENRVGPDYHKKWTVIKTRAGRCMIFSDDEWDERWEITGKKRFIEQSDEPSADEKSVFPILQNQTTICLDERQGQEKFLIHDYKGDFFKFDIEKKQLHIYFLDDIVIESLKNITLKAKQNINFIADMNLTSNIKLSDIKNVGVSKIEEIGVNKLTKAGANIENVCGASNLSSAAKIEEVAPLILEQGSLNVRKAESILDNSGGPNPQSPTPVNTYPILLAIRIAIEQLIQKSIENNIRDYLADSFLKSYPPVLYPMLTDLLKHTITEDVMKEVSEPYATQQAAENASANTGGNNSETQNAISDVANEKKEEASQNAANVEKKVQDAKDKNVGKIKNITQEQLDKAKNDIKAVKNKVQQNNMLNNIKNKINDIGSTLKESVKKTLNSSVNVIKKAINNGLSTNRSSISSNNINNTIDSFTNARNNGLDTDFFDTDKILNNLFDAKDNVNNSNFSSASENLNYAEKNTKIGLQKLRSQISSLVMTCISDYKTAKELAIKDKVSYKNDIQILLNTCFDNIKKVYKYIKYKELYEKSKFLRDNFQSLDIFTFSTEIENTIKMLNKLVIYMRNVDYVYVLSNILDFDLDFIYDVSTNYKMIKQLDWVQKQMNESDLILSDQLSRINENFEQTKEYLKNDTINVYYDVYKNQKRIKEEESQQSLILKDYFEDLESSKMIVSGNDFVEKIRHDHNFLENITLLTKSVIESKYLIDHYPRQYEKTKKEIQKVMSDLNQKISQYYNIENDIFVKRLEDETLDKKVNNYIEELQSIYDILNELQHILKISLFGGEKYKITDNFIENINNVLEDYNPITGKIETEETESVGNYNIEVINDIVQTAILQNIKQLSDKDKDIILNNIDMLSKNITDNIFYKLFQEDQPKFHATSKQIENIKAYNTFKGMPGDSNIIPLTIDKDPIDDTIKKIALTSKLAYENINSLIEIDLLGEKITV